jgi:hypothetical protein
VEFQRSVVIEADTRTVWSVMADIERWHEWTPSVRSIRRMDTGPFRVGSRALVRQPRFPPAIWKVTALDPERGFTWVSRAPGLRVSGHHAIEVVPDGSRVTLSVRYEGIIGRLLGRMTRMITQRYLAFEAAGLKERCEARSRGSSA